jgi:hypothetical protein
VKEDGKVCITLTRLRREWAEVSGSVTAEQLVVRLKYWPPPLAGSPGQGDTYLQCPPVLSDFPFLCCAQDRLFPSLALRPCFYSNQSTPYRRQVMVAVPHRMVLQEELAGQWRIGVEGNRRRAIEILVL